MANEIKINADQLENCKDFSTALQINGKGGETYNYHAQKLDAAKVPFRVQNLVFEYFEKSLHLEIYLQTFLTQKGIIIQ